VWHALLRDTRFLELLRSINWLWLLRVDRGQLAASPANVIRSGGILLRRLQHHAFAEA